MRIGVDGRNLVSNLSGIGRYVLEMCRALADQGHSIVLYLPEAPGKAVPDIPGCDVRIFDFKGPVRRFFWGNFVLPRAANADRLDVFWGPAHRLPTRLDPHLARVLTIHDLVWKRAAQTMRWQTWIGERLSMGAAVKTADFIVADSAATAADVRHFYRHANDKTVIIHPGLSHLPAPADASECLARWHIDGRYALFVGTLEPRKNLRRLLEAFAMLSEGSEGLLLVLAGGQGWRQDDLHRIIEVCGVADRVRLTGYVTDAELSLLYSRAHFLAMPSLYEGFGFPIIEANAAGVPALTSNISSLPEVAGDAAILVDPRNVKAIAAALHALATDTSIHARVAAHAKANASRFNWPTSAVQLALIFQQARHRRS